MQSYRLLSFFSIKSILYPISKADGCIFLSYSYLLMYSLSTYSSFSNIWYIFLHVSDTLSLRGIL
jgi:hypothetical protein